MHAIDIGVDEIWTAQKLTNFSAHSFVFRGCLVSSMEGLLQSLKAKDRRKQQEIMLLVGKEAKFAGKKLKWWKDQKVFFQGKVLDRHGQEFQELLDEAFEAMFEQNIGARTALLATGELELRHSIGKSDATRTILTEDEFTERLTRIRKSLQDELS
jgi:hypothetical protein